MGEKVCACGAGAVSFKPIGEDLWAALIRNATGKTKKGRRDYTCNACGSFIDYADHHMVGYEQASPTPSEGE